MMCNKYGEQRAGNGHFRKSWAPAPLIQIAGIYFAKTTDGRNPADAGIILSSKQRQLTGLYRNRNFCLYSTVDLPI